MAEYMLLCYHEETDAAEGVEREAELPLMLDRYTHLANEAGLDLQPYANLRSGVERARRTTRLYRRRHATRRQRGARRRNIDLRLSPGGSAKTGNEDGAGGRVDRCGGCATGTAGLAGGVPHISTRTRSRLAPAALRFAFPRRIGDVQGSGSAVAVGTAGPVARLKARWRLACSGSLLRAVPGACARSGSGRQSIPVWRLR